MGIILIAKAAVVSVFLAVAAFQSNEFTISRSITIDAAPSAVFPLVNDFRHWESWSPWGKTDSGRNRTFADPSVGEGATYAWTGTHEADKHKMTLIKSRPTELIRIELDLLKPRKAAKFAEFTFKTEGGGTVVTWSVSGRNSFGSKASRLFKTMLSHGVLRKGMDKVIGGELESGLALLKETAERSGRARE